MLCCLGETPLASVGRASSDEGIHLGEGFASTY
jgi:hypothetical protein